MCQNGIRVAGLDKLERSSSVMPGNRLVPEPDNRPVRIARELFGRGQDPHYWLQALLDKLRVGPLGKRVTVNMGELGEISERQTEPAAHPLRRDEIPFSDVCE